MLLLIDVGNTSTTYGLYRHGRASGIKHTETDKFPSILSKLIGNKISIPIEFIVLSSVVPKMTLKVRKVLKQNGKLNQLYVLGENLRVQIKHNYKTFGKLGRDRLANIYGSLKLYRPPLLIMDFGTALTCDYISRHGVFEGGLIIPGPEIALKALSERAALLPKVPFPKKGGSLLGRNTREGMQAGILQGVAAMTDGLIDRFKQRFGSSIKAIATGGLAPIIFPLTRKIDVLDPFLTLRSLALAFLEHGPRLSPLDKRRGSA